MPSFLRSLWLPLMLVTFLWGCSTTIAADPQTSAPLDSKNPDSDTSGSSLSLSPFEGQKLPVLAQVRLGDALIDLEVTRTPQEQALGLMFRPSLEDNRGMLFEFNPPRPVSFWMKNVVIALDMVFVREGTIRAIAVQVPPCAAEPCPTYSPEEEIDQVIELRGGRAAELNLKPGDPALVQWRP